MKDDPVALVVPNTVRYTIIGQNLERPFANIFDMFITNVGAGREAQIESAAEILVGAWANELNAVLPASYSALRCDWVDMTQQDGVTGSTTVGIPSGFPDTGSVSGAAYSGNCATLVRKNTEARRGQRGGRMFLPPMNEGDVTDGYITGSRVTSVQNGLDAFMQVLTDWGEDEIYPVVTHVQGNTQVGVPSRVTSLSLQAKMSSQRRRWRG